MANFYCDISAIGNEYQAYADTPTTWGIPQDGNGKAGPGHSAAVAVGTIDCASASASGGGVLGVLGVTVSSTLTGSGSTLATNIVTAINTTATATGASYSALLLPLNRLVFARVDPGNAAVVQIMLRIAGADWNGMTHTTAGTWGVVPTMGAFAGGADGPFAYIFNNATVFGKTVFLYGAWGAASAGVTEPSTTDVIEVRTKRGGVNLSYSVTVSATTNGSWKSRNFLYDNGTTWNDGSSSGGMLDVYWINTGGGTSQIAFSNSNAATVSHVSRSKYGLSVTVQNSSATALALFAVSTSSGGIFFAFVNCMFVVGTSNGTNRIFQSAAGAATFFIDFSGSRIVTYGVSHYVLAVTYNTAVYAIRLHGLSTEVIAAIGPIGAYVAANGAAQNGTIEWIGGSISDTNGVYKCTMPISVSGSAQNVQVLIDGVAGVTDPSVGFATYYGASKLVWSNTEGPDKGFRYEAAGFIVDWKGNGTFPHCGAQNLQGEYLSHRVTWGAAPNYIVSYTPMRLSRFYRSASAISTLTVEMYVPDATTIYTDEIEVGIGYLDSSDVWRTDDSVCARTMQFLTARSEISGSAKSWITNGVASHTAKKITLTTQYAIKKDTEILLRLSLVKSRATPITLYVSPEIGVVAA